MIVKIYYSPENKTIKEIIYETKKESNYFMGYIHDVDWL